MKNRLLLISLILITLFFLLPGNPVIAQDGSSAISILLEQVNIDDFPEINLTLNAWGQDGLPPSEITKDNFLLSEDGGALQPPTSLIIQNDAPLSVILVIDISHSMVGQPLADAKIAAARFLDRLSPGDRVAVIAFSDQLDTAPTILDPQWEASFTSDFAPLYDLIEKLQAGRGTHLYNAVSKAVHIAAQEPAGHRAILLLSDGRNDPPAIGSPDQPIQFAQEAHIPIFVIGLGSEIDEPYLQRLAEDTGGLFRKAPRSSELANLFSDMATLLKTQYLLNYTSQLPPDGKRHLLDVYLNTDEQNSSTQIEIGPLPYIPTITPTNTPSQTPTATHTIQPSKTPTITDTMTPSRTTTPQNTTTFTATPIPPTPTPTPSPIHIIITYLSSNTLIEIFIGPLLILLIGFIIWWIFFRRKKEQATKSTPSDSSNNT